MILSENRQTILNYIASIAVVIFGLWLLSDKPPSKKITINLSHDSAVVHSLPDDEDFTPYKQAVNGEMSHSSTYERVVKPDNTVYSSNDSTVRPISEIKNQPLQNLAAGSDRDLAVNEGDDISDSAWFTGLMQKAKSIKDRVINIDISGSSATGQVNVPGVNINADINDEDSLLPQPTESDSLVENTVDCAAVMYMGGNAYGRNMLIKMGCPVP